MNYFLNHPNQRAVSEAPHSADQIRNMLASGKLQPEHVVYPDAGGMPVRADSVPAPTVATPPPLPAAVSAASTTANNRVPPPHFSNQPKTKGSLLWLWILLSIGGFFAILTLAMVITARYIQAEKEKDLVSEVPIMEERSSHQPEWQKPEGYESDGQPDKPDPKVFQLVHYPSEGVGEMAAYLTPDPGDGKKHPVMIWAKGGFGGIGNFLWRKNPSRFNDQTARAFREAGIVLMCPSFRGENSNPGKYELFYGEVNDLIAAVDYVKKLPYVDTDRVYLGGHSTGGTLALLAAVSGVECEGIFSFGGDPSLISDLGDEMSYENSPFDFNNKSDLLMRSAIRYTQYIKSPTWYIEGDLPEYRNEAQQMQEFADEFDVPFSAFIVEKADHFDILNPVTNLIADKIVNHTEGAELTLSIEEIDVAWDKVHDISLSSELTRWMKDGGDLEVILSNLDSDIEPSNQAELKVLSKAIDHAVAQQNDPPNSDIGELAEIIDYIESESMAASFVNTVGEKFTNYIETQLKSEKRHVNIESNCMRIAGSFAIAEDEAIIPFIGKLAEQQVLPEDDNWEYILDELESDGGFSESLLAHFKANPVGGNIGDVVLGTVNNLMIDDPDILAYHPYNSEAGFKVLKQIIDEDDGGAFHATLALAFIDEKFRKQLLPIVYKHESYSVRMEAAWGDAKHGGEPGIKLLQEACDKIHYSAKAKRYLEELELSDKIPESAKEPEWVALTDIYQRVREDDEVWGNAGRLEQIDSREIIWPPTGEKTQLHLIRFLFRREKEGKVFTGYGLAGDQALSFLDKYPKTSIPELYAKHCAEELNRAGNGQSEKTNEVSITEALKEIKRVNPGVFDDLKKKPKKDEN